MEESGTWGRNIFQWLMYNQAYGRNEIHSILVRISESGQVHIFSF